MNKCTYTFSIGGKDFVDKAIYLTKSIYLVESDPDIVTYILPSERENLSTDVLDFFQTRTDLMTGSRPIPDYPISAKLAAFKYGAKKSERDYIVHMDTDTLLLNNFDEGFVEDDADVLLSPVDIGNQYWGLPESFNEWRTLYNSIGAEFPSRRIISTVDNIEIPPYYNAGVVITTNSDFPEEWLDVTKLVREYTTTRYADQVALGLLSTRYTVRQQPSRCSWIVPLRFRHPSDIFIMRYQEYYNLIGVRDTHIKRKFKKIGIDKKIKLDSESIKNYIIQMKKTARIRLLKKIWKRNTTK